LRRGGNAAAQAHCIIKYTQMELPQENGSSVFLIILRFFESKNEKTGENARKREIVSIKQKNLKKTG